MLLRGPEARLAPARTFGGLIAGVLFVLPGLVCLIALSRILRARRLAHAESDTLGDRAAAL